MRLRHELKNVFKAATEKKLYNDKLEVSEMFALILNLGGVYEEISL